uniref:Protein spire homolog 1-like n=1 Tax=Callorhinchus milii TaxID=7868 RepID=A0A4W3GEH1_CALMI
MSCVVPLPAPPMFLPISSTPQPERRKAPQRRHSIEKETPTNVRQFLPPSRQSSKSLVPGLSGLLMTLRSCFPGMHTASLLRSYSLEGALLSVMGAVYFMCKRVYGSGWKTTKVCSFASLSGL